MTDFFDLDFTALPHKLLQPDQFEQQVLELRARFVDPKDPSFAFKPAYHKRIPADGFAPYLSGIWVGVDPNKVMNSVLRLFIPLAGTSPGQQGSRFADPAGASCAIPM